MKVNFYLHNQSDSTGRNAVYCRYSHDSEDYRFPVKYESEGGIIRINPDAWIKSNKDLQLKIKARNASRKDKPFRVKKEHPLSRVINLRLDTIEKEIYTICNDLLLNSKTPFVSDVKNEYQLQNKTIDIFSIFDRFMIEKRKTSKSATVQNFLSFEARLLEYSESFKVHPNKLDVEFLLSFREFLAQKGNSVSSIKAYVNRFKTFLFWAYQNEYIKSNKFEQWKVEKQEAIHTYLKPDEIKRLINVDLPDKLGHARNVLLFSCFTGMRAGEIRSLTPLSERNEILTFETGKVKGKVSKLRQIKLNELALPLWEKLKQNPIRINKHDIKYMKEAGKIAGIDSLIPKMTSDGIRKVQKYTDFSPNTGRRTFISLSHQFEIPENFIALIVGHERQSMTSHYDKTEISQSFSYMEHWAKSYLKAVS